MTNIDIQQANWVHCIKGLVGNDPCVVPRDYNETKKQHMGYSEGLQSNKKRNDTWVVPYKITLLVGAV